MIFVLGQEHPGATRPKREQEAPSLGGHLSPWLVRPRVFGGTRFISRNIYSPKIFLRVIVEVFNEILEEKTTNEIKQTDLLVEKSAEIYCSNLFRPKRSSTKINHRNVRWIFHRKKQRIF